jgi:exonuclease SbcC
MRPVRLDLAGFASFREPAVVDFTGADYFALVGPTGSGKSTVIDAMTFALYGSAPRWGKVNAIADALAPTATRCTVRLVFDLGPTRYVVAREVRRSGKSVLQKNVVLERLADPNGTGAEDEDSEVIAGDLKDVNRTIEKLLGLSFTDFCQCIVLPQGQFAEFLKATPKDRQEILLKLLGAGHYEAIAKSATARAALAGEKATILGAQLGDLAEATEEAETAARTREAELGDLATAIDQRLPVIAEQTARVEAVRAEQQRLDDEHDRLTAEQSPEGLADLQSSLDAADRERRLAAEREAAAVADDTRARAELAAGPSRAQLEIAIDRHREFAELTARRPGVAATDRSTAERQVAAEAAVAAAEQAVTAGRAAAARSGLAETAATAAREVLRQRRAQFAAVRTPAGVEALGARTLRARRAVDTARRRREAAELADQQARDAVREAPARGPLEQARIDLEQLQVTRDRIAGLTREQELYRAEVKQAKGSLRKTRDRVAAARQAYEQAVDARTAATLRPHLVAGHACPVCEQTVAVLPPPLAATELDAAKQDVTEAEARLSQVQEQLAEVTRHEAVATSELRSATEYFTKLTAALVGQPEDAGTIDAELARLDGLVAATEAAARELTGARDAERRALGALEELAQQTSTARSGLVAAHGPLIALGAPVLDDTDLPAAWSMLTGWTADQLDELDRHLLPAADTELKTATAEHKTAQRTLERAERDLASAQSEHTEAVRARAQAGGALEVLTARLAELESVLAAAPTAEAAAAQLVECARLEAAAQRSDREIRAARRALAAAEEIQAQWNAKADQARRELRLARDRLVPLGAPELDDDNLTDAWSALLSWAEEQAAARRQLQPEILNRIETAVQERDSAIAELRSQVTDHGILFQDGESPGVLPTRLAGVLERARAETRTIAEKRSRAAALAGEMASAREAQQVAKLLADLLRFDKFPRWLASAALDTLVADASAALSDLSGGQFDLSHDRGDFVVIDHADADSRRSVRTLSGGETFQASLALALALSAQLSTLAAEGAARLDSIFLDEGFGTLDPETLEVVAGTLENLAHGERMVGVITHVAALAERAPVRFAVHRDSRTSSIVREGA